MYSFFDLTAKCQLRCNHLKVTDLQKYILSQNSYKAKVSLSELLLVGSFQQLTHQLSFEVVRGGPPQFLR